MNYGGDAADQIVRYSLEGTEVALKLTGEAAKNFAVFAAAVLRDQKKMHGKTNVRRMWLQRNTVWTSVPFPLTVCAKCAPVWSRRSRGAF